MGYKWEYGHKMIPEELKTDINKRPTLTWPYLSKRFYLKANLPSLVMGVIMLQVYYNTLEVKVETTEE